MGLTGDFNINPFLLGEDRTARALDKIPLFNSTLYHLALKKAHTVTVDGILLSRQEKQRVQSSLPMLDLLGKLKKENQLSIEDIDPSA
jgi:hypothetical protein